MEKIPSSMSPRSSITEKDVNVEINDTELVLSRVRHPVIAAQLYSLLQRQEIELLKPFKEDVWEAYLPEGWTGEERFKLFKNLRTGAVADSEDLERYRNTPYPTLETIKRHVDENVAAAEMVTPVDFTSNSPNAGTIGLFWKLPNGERPSTKLWSTIEAHEKGHLIRDYKDVLNNYFLTGFDLTAPRFSANDLEVLNSNRSQSTDEEVSDATMTLEEFGKEFMQYYLFSASEIAERMSQLKNYFGFKGDEYFTVDHLEYAREHYLHDAGFDNGMRLFFEAITPDTEQNFLLLINQSGI